ncbi:MAG: methionyl-tRNA formyltransferase [Clostridia bacterium]|nr:methionyl-tRNA formyltransferase [Clostridia bacterium]
MRIVYMGTPDFAVLPLKTLLNRKSDQVVAVVTNPDKPVGRKKIITPCPVKVVAKECGVQTFSYNKIRIEGVEDLKRLMPDIIVTCAFGQILSEEILNIPKFGVINVHASLLPKYRGASPIHYAILNGEKTTGVTIMKTDVGIDDGDMLISREIQIVENETCGELFERLSIVGAELLDFAMDLIESGKAKFTPQDSLKATFTKMIRKEDALINWENGAENVKNQIRAFNPSPVAYTFYNGEQIKIYDATVCADSGIAGEILCSDGSLIVGCKNGSIKINSLQKSGGKRMSTADFLRGNKISVGEYFKNA